MDSKLKRKALLITILGAVIVLIIVLSLNITTIKNRLKESSTDDSFGRFNGSVENESYIDESKNALQGTKPFNIGDNLSSWKYDETFFDNEADTLTAKLLKEMAILSVFANSIEKDIRIQIHDYEGNLKSGERFEVRIKNVKENKEETYFDDDKDGVIYVSDLSPNEYEVALQPIEGFFVPDNATAIKVKESVEYVMIDDISLLVKNESQINKRNDDTMVVSASDDADKRMPTKFLEDENLIYGVDVSSDNGDIDWNEVYKSGIRFVMLRAGYRGASSGDLIIDDAFVDNAKKANMAGLDVGAYFYTQAVSEIEAVEEASALILLTKSVPIEYPLAIRFDMAGGFGRADSLDADARTKIAETFCQTIKNMGQDPCVYASRNWLNTNLNAKLIEKYKVWMAEFRAKPTYEGYYDMWQYTCKGNVPGINGEVNLNISYIGN